MRPIEDQLRDIEDRIRTAFSESGKTLDEVLAASGLEITRASMSRKMTGKQGISPSECEVLAPCFGLRVISSSRGLQIKAA